MRAYLHHAALNFGVALEAIRHIVEPPQTHHDRAALDHLASGSTLRWFLWGIGAGPEP